MGFLTYEKVSLVKQVIELAENCRLIREEMQPESEPGSMEKLFEFLESENGKKMESEENKLKDFLMNRSYEEVKFIQTIMYLGRDPEDYKNTSPELLYSEVFLSMSWVSKEAEVNQIVGKAPLGDYLKSGLKLLNS
ncbi:DUF3775 domain-containing protein [Lysinibacillus sphaericus]|uniref:DUF3775 domain-containing protein n=1 Tax=Lysinibacillus sphaericus TaxID=1421 RepID=UPI001A9CDF2F|nr:DUF3775 domain-containing protein [Lysinibacillus sphaericus]QTB29083.1 DUF3775 domain-containing protein [Lysinibacillus sphaericus]